MNQRCMIPVIKTPKDYRAYRISPDDTNRLAIIFDSTSAGDSLTVCVEIFDPGGKTPPHRHNFAVEMFFILKGQGIAVCDGKEVPLNPGDSILMPKTGIHFIKNTGTERLYALCMMVPNEDFSELILSGMPTELDEQDLQVITRIDSLIPC
ncbi:Cupin 2 conserved barrel domain protein [Stanieria cyanosphaera PCC 7437]|uniref:Cupin 2 conserved barrel domain protein n=1 Tax=Stanieria cyanosphaera (strain ATCC 29371 / PCC 7437) TaxID=111780 RepID=K9XUN7_STAC7|nr:cupin domain-containing protein [Stanieria cyanosphaera]AFZ36315.1 Cupin 2 conserved barrel domain protein [Stanieria cyanosphaera PCC 7437]